MRFGWLYFHPLIYDTAHQVRYWGKSRQRLKEVAARIPDGAHVVDLCAGTASLHRELKNRAVRYQALDINPTMVRRLRRAGIDARCGDVRHEPFPEADVLTMCSSLYHFFPDCEEMIQRMIEKARLEVIIAEPVVNAAHSRSRLLRWIGRSAGIVDGKMMDFYFDRESFVELVERFPEVVDLRFVEPGRDMIAVFRGTAPG